MPLARGEWRSEVAVVNGVMKFYDKTIFHSKTRRTFNKKENCVYDTLLKVANLGSFTFRSDFDRIQSKEGSLKMVYNRLYNLYQLTKPLVPCGKCLCGYLQSTLMKESVHFATGHFSAYSMK